MLLTRPDNLKAEHQDLLARLTAACHEMTQLAAHIGGLRPAADTPTRKRRRARALDRPSPCSRPAPSACLHAGPGPRPRRRHRRVHAPVQQRTHRRHQPQDQADREANVRAGPLHPSTPPHPPRMTSRSATTEYEPGPKTVQTRHKRQTSARTPPP
jgi:hypothetical protein